MFWVRCVFGGVAVYGALLNTS